MAVLNQWQRIDRVLPGKPWGDGKDGSYSSATIPSLTKDSCSGSADSTTLTTTGSTFANGDLLLIHQTRGTGVGQWEINRVASGGGSTSLTLAVALHYTYTDSGASQAQAIKILRHTNVTVQTGTWTVPSWDGNVGGIFPLAVKGDLTISGTINADSAGHRAGDYTALSGISGESPDDAATGGVGGTSLYNIQDCGGGGGGGSYAANGSNGTNSTCHGAAGGAGDASRGATDLTNLFMGSGGGAGGKGYGGAGGSGEGHGGGTVIIFAKNISITGGISVKGHVGKTIDIGNATGGSGGGGAGAILVVCKTGVFGTTLCVSSGGGGGTGGTGGGHTGGNGGAGAAGRIAVHHSGAVTGTTNPAYTDISDPTLVERGGFMALL